MRIYLQSSDQEIFDFNSKTFNNILKYIKDNPNNTEIKKKNNKIYLIFKEIRNLEDAITLYKKFDK